MVLSDRGRRAFADIVQRYRQSGKCVTQFGIFDDHAIENCNYTGRADGRHYKELNLVRVRYLANLLQALPVRSSRGPRATGPQLGTGE